MRMAATHFLMRTLPKVATEMALHVLAYNLTRVMNIVGIKPSRAIDMFQAKELAREKGCKKERSADPAAERQYDAVIQQARRAPERTRCHAASNRRAVLIWECSGRFDVFVAAASRDIIRDTKAAIAPRKNEGATAFEKICVSLSMSGTNSILQLLGLRLWA
jgi:hypothetical protein